MAKISKITDEMIVKGKGKIDFYMLRGILPVARSWPKRRKTPFRPRELEAQGVFGILSKSTTFIQDKVKEAWIVESVGKRPRWQDTFIGLGMKYWGINGEIPLILIDYQIHWHSPNPEIEVLLQKIEAKYGKTEAQEIQTTGIVDIKDIEAYREKLYISIYDNKGLRLIAPFLKFIIGKNIDFSIYLQKLTGLIEEPAKVCFHKANVLKPKTKTYYYHGVKYKCADEVNPDPLKCFPLEKKPEFVWEEWRAHWIMANDYEKDLEDLAGNHWYNEPWGYNYQDGQAATGWNTTYFPDYESWTYWVIYKRGKLACRAVSVYTWEDSIVLLCLVDIRVDDEWINIFGGEVEPEGWNTFEFDPPRIITGVRYRWRLKTRYPFYIPEFPESASILLVGNEFYGYEVE